VSDSRRKLGGFAVLALVLLRLAIGWHFFTEGVDKLEYDPTAGRVRVAFSAEGFLTQAKGPLAGYFHALAPDGHGWKQLLAVPHQIRPLSAAESADEKRTPPYHVWAERIVDDWNAILASATAVPGLTEDQIRQAKEAFALRKQELADYLETQSAAMAEYQHELWRLEQWRATPEAGGVPFQQERIATKTAETSALPTPWVKQVAELEQGLLADFREILAPAEAAAPASAAATENALTSPQQARLKWVSLAATGLTIGVGVCLLLGFFTRLASVAGALFLLSVIAAQPPWLPGVEPTIHQTVELSGLLVLAGTGAGRWLGLDYFTWALFGRHE